MAEDIRYKGSGNLIKDTKNESSENTIRASFDASKESLALEPSSMSCLSTDIAHKTLKAAESESTFYVDEQHLSGNMKDSYVGNNDSKEDIVKSAAAEDSAIKTNSSYSSPTRMNKERMSALDFKCRHYQDTYSSSYDKHKGAADKAQKAAKEDGSSFSKESSAESKAEDFKIHEKHSNAPSSLRPPKYDSSVKCLGECASGMAGTICQNALYHSILSNDMAKGYRQARVYANAVIMPVQFALAAISAQNYKDTVKAVRKDLIANGVVNPLAKDINLYNLARSEKVDISGNIREMRKLLIGGDLNDKQKTIVSAAIKLKTARKNAYSIRHAKRSFKRVIRRAVRYGNQDNETYRMYISLKFSLSYRLSKIALKSALKITKGAAYRTGYHAANVSIKGAKKLYNSSETVKETVDAVSAISKKAQKKIRHETKNATVRVERFKRRSVKAAESEIKKAGIRILGRKKYDAAVKAGKRISKVRQGAKKTGKAIRNAIGNVTGTISRAIGSVSKALSKYIIIPALIIILSLSMTSIFGGSIISVLSVMESGFLKVDGGNADTFDDSMLSTIAVGTKELNRLFDKTVQNTTMLTADITTGITESAIYDAIKDDIAVVVSTTVNVTNDVKSFLNQNYGTSFEIGEEVESDDVILYIDDYRISCVDADGNELPSIDLNNDGTLFSMASVYQQQDIGGENPFAWKNRAAYVNYSLFLCFETHRFGIETEHKGPCENNGVSWKEDHGFICKNGHWGTCEESGKYKNGTHNGINEGARHKKTGTRTNSVTGETESYTYYVNCDGSDVYWECPGHIDVTSKVIVGSLDKPIPGDDKMDPSQMEKDSWVFSMDYLGCNTVLGTAEFIADFNLSLVITARSFAINKIATALGWETMANDSADIFNHYVDNLDPRTIWKGWFNPETRQDNWEWVRLFYLAGEEVDSEGKKGWETIYGYKGEAYPIFSGVSGGGNTTSGGGNATKEEILAAMSEYDLTPFQESLMEYAIMAAEKPVYYYWGGSPSASDIGTVAHFGTSVDPDYKGRNRKGLDCSGFICWCYRSAGKTNFLRYDTSSMVSALPGCEPKEMVPGDVIVYNHASSGHVKLFAGYKDGTYYFIESAGAPANRVIFSKCESFTYLSKDMSGFR